MVVVPVLGTIIPSKQEPGDRALISGINTPYHRYNNYHLQV